MCPVRPRTIVLTVVIIPHLMAVPTVTTTVVITVNNLIIIVTTKMDPLLVNSNYKSGIVVFRDQR